MNLATVEADAVKFLTRVKCALCDFVDVIEHTGRHPHCPKCGGPTRLETKAVTLTPSNAVPGAAAPPQGVNTAATLSNVQEVIHDLGSIDLPPGSA